MGTHLVAIAGFGLVLNTKPLEGETHAVSSCQHEERHGQKFCPICGVKVSTRQEKGYERENEFSAFFHETMSLPDGWVEDWGEYTGVFIGFGFTVDNIGDTEFMPMTDIPDREEILTTIREVLVDWPEVIDETKFGFHLIQSGH